MNLQLLLLQTPLDNLLKHSCFSAAIFLHLGVKLLLRGDLPPGGVPLLDIGLREPPGDTLAPPGVLQPPPGDLLSLFLPLGVLGVLFPDVLFDPLVVPVRLALYRLSFAAAARRVSRVAISSSSIPWNSSNSSILRLGRSSTRSSFLSLSLIHI